MYGTDHGDGFEWVNAGLQEFLQENELLLRAAVDVIRDPGHGAGMREFWLAKFLRDALYGSGLPFMRLNSRTVDAANFEHCDFMSLAQFILLQHEGMK